MTDVANLLVTTRTVLLVDWPSRDVPDTLARHGYTVVSSDGPDEYNEYGFDDEVQVVSVDGPPAQADLIYTHRPIAELPEIVEMALSVGAKAVWVQSGRELGGAKDPHGCWLPPDESTEARHIVESAGLTYVDAPYIADAVRDLG